MTNAGKDALSNFASKQLLEDEPLDSNQLLVQEILASRDAAQDQPPQILQKPQEKAGEYEVKSNRGDRQLIASQKPKPWTYCGIDIV